MPISQTAAVEPPTVFPVTVQMQWIQRFGGDPLAKGNERWLRRLLNDPEWRHLRTSSGKV